MLGVGLVTESLRDNSTHRNRGEDGDCIAIQADKLNQVQRNRVVFEHTPDPQ